MAKQPTGDDLLAQLDDLGIEETAGAPPVPKATSVKRTKPKPTSTNDDDDDALAELESLAKSGRPASRPTTPKLSAPTAKKGGAATPASSGSNRTSEDKTHVPNPPRKSGESTRSYHQSYTPATDDSMSEKRAPAAAPREPAQQQAGSGWWGGIFGAASAAVKQAEATYKDLQQNQDAQRWAEQVKGNVGALRGFGDELRSRALPTFTNILHTIAPPISSHERLQIHITHDLVGYPSLDPLIYETFARVMQQVEGGDLMVIQRGSESTQRRASDAGYMGSGSSGWRDGPWWRQKEKRDMGAVMGVVEGTKLARVGAESYANDFFSARGGVEEAAKQATQVLSESNPVRSSDIFLAIQAVKYNLPDDQFAGPAEEKKDGGVLETKEAEELIAFAIYLHDPIHSISFRTLSQTFPQRWADWLDAPAGENELPPEILEIIETGGVDPREWVAEWVEDTLGLSVGIVAQRYVARRMGVGEGGIGRGKAKDAAVDISGGEAARVV